LTDNLNHNIFIRLVTLWIIIEAFLGGIVHATKLPISGILIGGGAIICISMIAFYVDDKSSILKATILVAIFKMLLSPHSPPPAYLAVFFQGLIGYVLFMRTNFFMIRSIFFSVICFFESAIQRILVMTIIYGKGFWDTINVFIQGITQKMEITNYSLILVSCYVIIHLIIGLFIGVFISKIPTKLTSFVPHESEVLTEQNSLFHTKKASKKSSFIWLFAIAMLSGIYWLSSNNILFSAKLFNQIIGIIFRSSIILTIWKFIIGPYIIKYLKKYLMSTSKKYQYQIEAINNILPEMKYLLNEAWLLSKEQSKFNRLKYFILHVLHRTVYVS
jgi:hypothetical protein